MSDRKNTRLIIQNYKREMEAAATYHRLAEIETDERRKALFAEIAGMEQAHAAMWRQRLDALGIPVPRSQPGLKARWYGFLARKLGPVNTLERIEKDEQKHAAIFARQLGEAQGEDASILKSIAHDEDELARRVHIALAGSRAQGELDSIMHRERWHIRSGGWVADAIYGANDGLGAVFGIVSGMAGYTGGSKLVLVAGLAGTVAGAISMGSSAYLASKSEKEVLEAELARERLEIEQDPEEEKRELQLFYKLKGFSDDEAAILVNRISQSPDDMLSTLAHEELGISHASTPNPYVSMTSATIATALGGSIPLLPFFVMSGMPAVAVSLVVSLAAHFVVGVLKSLITTRNWFASGMEMTVVGVIVSAVTFALGKMLEGMGLPAAG